MAIRPENITIHAPDATAPERNVLSGRVRTVTYTGATVDYFVETDADDAPIRVQATPPVRFETGETVLLSFASESTVLLDGDGSDA